MFYVKNINKPLVLEAFLYEKMYCKAGFGKLSCQSMTFGIMAWIMKLPYSSNIKVI
jgi:hypothetical protein